MRSRQVMNVAISRGGVVQLSAGQILVVKLQPRALHTVTQPHHKII